MINIKSFKSKNVVLIYNLIILTLLSVAYSNFGILIVGMVGLLVLFFCAGDVDRSLEKILLIGSTVAVAWMLVQYYALIAKYGEPYYGGDDQLFELYGNQLFNSGIYTFEKIPYISGMYYAKGYLVIISWLNRIGKITGGYHTLFPRILNIYLWLAVAAMVFNYLKTIETNEDNYKKKMILSLLMAVFPNALYISSFVYRDTTVIFVLFNAIYCIHMEQSKGRKISVKCILICAFDFYLLYYMRSQLIYVLILMIIVQLFWPNRSKHKAVYGIIIGVVCLVILAFSGGIELLNRISSNYQEYRSTMVEGMSNFIFSARLFPFGIVLRVIWGLVSPFPGAVFSLDFINETIFSFLMLAVYIGTIVQITGLPYLFDGVLRFDRDSISFLIIFLSIVGTTFTFRHFLMLYPFMVLVVFKGMRNFNNNKMKHYTKVIWLAVLLLLLVYLVLKI